MIRLRADGTAIPVETFDEMAARYKAASAAFAADMRLLIDSGYFRRPPPSRMPYVPIFKRGPDGPNFHDNGATVEIGE